MSLDLGTLIARVVVEDVQAQRTLTLLMARFQAFGAEAAKASAGTGKLDEGLVSVGTAADKATAGVTRASRSTTELGAAEQKAALQAAQFARATADVAVVMDRTSTATDREQAAQLRLLAAQDRLTATQEAGTATTRQLAGAQAALIGAADRAAAAQEAAAASTGRFGTAMAGTLKTAGELGLVFGGFELVKKAIDVTKEATQFQRDMLLVQTQAGATAGEIKTLTADVLGISGEVATGPDKLANSLYHVYSVGLRGAEAMNVVKIAAEGAKVGQADLEQTTNALTAAVASGIPGVKNMSQAMGALNTIVGSGDMKLQDLNEALGSGILVVAKQFGLNLTDVGAALATFGDNNIRGAEAATMLRVAITSMANPVAKGGKELATLGLATDSLAKDMQSGGLNKAIVDLSTHLTAAGITGSKVGEVLTVAFGKKAGPGVSVLVDQLARLQSKIADIQAGSGSFGDRWKATTQTAAFAFEKLGAEAQSAAISLTGKAMPALTNVGNALAQLLPAAVTVAVAALHPFEVVWHDLSVVLVPIAHTLATVASSLAPIAPVAEAVGTSVLTMWLAFKGYQVARAAVTGLVDVFGAMQVKAVNTALSVQTSLESVSGAAVTSADITALAAKRADAAALQSASVQTRATAMKAQAFADSVAASAAATDAEVANADRVAAAALAAAKASVTAAGTAAAAADTAAADIDTAGAAASIGWRSVLGPLGLAAVGVLTLVSMFHKSATASQEATDAAKAYTDALSSGGKSDLLQSIRDQLANNDLPQKVDDLNKALGGVQFTAEGFATAIAAGNPALQSLRDHLEAVVQAGTTFTHGPHLGAYDVPSIGTVEHVSQAAKDAAAALNILNTQYTALSKTQQKDLIDTKAFAGVSASLDQVAQSTKVASGVATQYAAMLGFVADKNGIVAASHAAVTRAVTTVSNAYQTATQTGAAFLTALGAFSKSAGTAADRASMIGATLVAANGDALSYTGAMAAAGDANQGLVTSISQAAQAVVKGGETNHAYLASIINMTTGTIDYAKAGAGPLVASLQSVQTAAMNAAQATYQHARATMSGKDAADAAYNVYKTQTSGALEAEAHQLGLTADQAKALANRYFGIPGHVKTLIEQEGANPIVTVLNKIGTLLAHLAGVPWTIPVNAKTEEAAQRLAQLKTLEDQLHDKSITITTYNQLVTAGQGSATAGHHAVGGTVGGSGGPTADDQLTWLSTGEEVINAQQAAKQRPLLKAINAGVAFFAAGGTVGGTHVGYDILTTQLISGLRDLRSGIVVSLHSVAASLASVLGRATASVASTIAAAIAPKITDPKVLAATFGTDQGSAVSSGQRSVLAGDNYTLTAHNAAVLTAQLTNLKGADKSAQAAAAAHAGTLALQAAAAKKAGDSDAKALALEAVAAKQTAADLKTADTARETALAKEVAAANTLAAKAKQTYGTISQAAKNSAAAAAQAATDLVAAVQSQVDAMTGQITTFEDGIKQGLVGDDSLSTLWGQLTSNVTSASSALQSAQQAVDQAAPAHAALAVAQQQQAAATTALATATAAFDQAGNSSYGTQTWLDAMDARAQAVLRLSAANDQLKAAQAAASSEAGASADQLAALSAAQASLAQAQAAASATGLQSSFNTILASAQTFAGDLQSLVTAGANQDVISQIAGMGTQAGDLLAKQLLAAGPQAIAALQTTMSQISALAGTSATALAGSFYGPGASALEQFIAGLESQFPALQAALQPMINEIDALFGAAGIAVPAGLNPPAVPSVPGFASGVTDFRGGLAYVHQGEMLVNLPRHTDVIPANRVKSGQWDDKAIVSELRALRFEFTGLAEAVGREVAVSGSRLYERAGEAGALKVARARRAGRL